MKDRRPIGIKKTYLPFQADKSHRFKQSQASIRTNRDVGFTAPCADYSLISIHFNASSEGCQAAEAGCQIFDTFCPLAVSSTR